MVLLIPIQNKTYNLLKKIELGIDNVSYILQSNHYQTKKTDFDAQNIQMHQNSIYTLDSKV